MTLRPPIAVTRAELQRKSRAAVAARKALRAAFERCGAVIFVLPPYVMAHVPVARFAQLDLAGFMLRPARNEDKPRQN